MLDGNGVLVSLLFDLTERLTRFVARQCFTSEDRGCFRFLELEELEVVSTVIRALPRCLGSYDLRFNNARKTHGILNLCRVPNNARREVLRLLANEVLFYVHAGPSSTQASRLKPGRTKFVTKRMKHYGASASSIDALKPFFLLPEECLTSLDIIELEVQKLFANNRAFANRDSATAANGNTGSASPINRKQIQKRDA
ncbi:unnamed protein product [Peronospora farinosa]|uniref:Uncharacterized protein n=1 Tax=Peronospora farinosa TaxID=134698 RepID=A0AAV0TPM8_9STRA|nr:unnamed protein product [Peronospora farinosa]